MTKSISNEKLQSLRKSNEGFLLIDVMEKAGFDKDHIPGARNVPLDSPDFAQAVALKSSGSKTRKVVLYCASSTCDQSTKAAKILVAAGFSDVSRYEGGLSGWNESKRAKAANKAKIGDGSAR